MFLKPRLSKLVNMLAQIYHVAVTAYYFYVSHWMIENVINYNDKNNVQDPQIRILRQYSNRYLTNWTFTLQNIYFASSVIEDVFRLISGNERLKNKFGNIRSYTFAVLAGPAAILVSVVFWGIWAIDRNLIFPTIMDTVLPPWINHSLHTFTTLFIIGELIVNNHRYPTLKQALPGITIYLALYIVCLLRTYYESGIWLYPFFKLLEWPARITFFISTYLFAILLFITLRFTGSVIWSGKSDPVLTKKQKKKI